MTGRERDDIDLEAFSYQAEERPYQEDPSRLAAADRARMTEAGIMLGDGSGRSGTFIQMDHSVVHCNVVQDGLEVMSSTEALERHPWLSDYWWRAVDPSADRFTAQAQAHQHHGYFIRALPGKKVIHPTQACLYLSQPGLSQNVHNVVIAEEGSELHIITGCTTSPDAYAGLHIGISEFYVKRGARLTFTMIHNFAPEVEVRPRTGIVVEEGGIFLSNYVCMKPVHSLQMYPTARCVGPGAIVRFNSVLVATPGSSLDVGSRAILAASGTRAEIISRAVTVGGDIVARGHLVGQVAGAKGHLECRGLILSPEGTIHAIPELDATVADVELSHEAAVGKIAEEEVEYLMARGLSRDEAVAAIVRGFLRVDIEGLPSQLEDELRRAVEMSERDLL